MVEDLLCLDAHDFLQDILNYGSAILVAAESIGDRFFLKPGDWALENPLPKWVFLMNTTRKLIAHNTVFPHQAIFRNTIANNIRNLYRLFGIDLADTWRSIRITRHESVGSEDNPNEFDRKRVWREAPMGMWITTVIQKLQL